MARTVIPTADLKGKKRLTLIGWKSQHGWYDFVFFLKRERKRKREIIIKYIINNSQNTGFSAMNAGGRKGIPAPPPPPHFWLGGGAGPPPPPVPTPMYCTAVCWQKGVSAKCTCREKSLWSLSISPFPTENIWMLNFVSSVELSFKLCFYIISIILNMIFSS